MTDQWDAPEFGLKAALGFELEHRDGSVCAVLEIGEVHLNPNGVVHGAVPFTLMDTAMEVSTKESKEGSMEVTKQESKEGSIEVLMQPKQLV